MKIGFHASHELWRPSELLRHACLAAELGFSAGMCSDHFHPWTTRGGQSGFAWSWLSAALQASQLTFGTVCAPGQRYHPAIIAQAAATLAEMYPGRFWLAVGSGEALNESITGQPWPEHSLRNKRLRECVDILRRLWSGETVDHDGLVTVRNAKLYTLPADPVLVIGAALTPVTAEWMGSWADGLITVGRDATQLQAIVDAFRRGGGGSKPIYLQSAVSLAATESQAIEQAHRQWPQCALSGEELADLPTPGAFDRATRGVTAEQVAACIRASADIKRHRDWLAQDRELGFDVVYLHHLGGDQEYSLRRFAAEVLSDFAEPACAGCKGST